MINRNVLLLAVCLSIVACTAPVYTDGDPLVRVIPTKMYWDKPGATIDDANSNEWKCNQELRRDPEYMELIRQSSRITLDNRYRTKEEKRKKRELNDAMAALKRECMQKSGFRYVPRGVPIRLSSETNTIAPPPRTMWVKNGVDYVEASRRAIQCTREAEASPEYSEARRNGGGPQYIYSQRYKCMTDQGFVFRELEEQELPPCWYVTYPPCIPGERQKE